MVYKNKIILNFVFYILPVSLIRAGILHLLALQLPPKSGIRVNGIRLTPTGIRPTAYGQRLTANGPRLTNNRTRSKSKYHKE
jgi:hypothetical protein